MKAYRDSHPQCRLNHRQEQKRYINNNTKKIKAQRILNNGDFPLQSVCAFCGVTEHLEHGHIDYDYPELYLTVCHRCNTWMSMDYVSELKDAKWISIGSNVAVRFHIVRGALKESICAVCGKIIQKGQPYKELGKPWSFQRVSKHHLECGNL
jgi:hypothetical protein